MQNDNSEVKDPDQRRDDALRRALSTPPHKRKPSKKKPKESQSK